ncbi:MAG: HNH endonuclease signature motif containing protein [Endomicrobiaceae bacterium]
MAFSVEVKKEAFKRAGGKCESCRKELIYEHNGRDTGKGAWEAHHRLSVESGGTDVLSNCKILCWECHEKTL